MHFLYKNQEFYHKDNEFESYTIANYENLSFKKNIGDLERKVRLLKDFSKEFYNCKCDLISFGCSNSGFIPIMSSNYFSNVHIIDINNSDIENVTKNIGNNKNIYIKNVFELVDGIIIIENNEEIDINNFLQNIIISYKSLENSIKLKNSNIYIYIPEKLKEKFNKSFSYCFEDNEFNYNNLIEYTMIIKNGGEVLKNVLENNKKYIDRWTILDTGSTDGTQDVIKEVLKDKKGELYEHPFDNFRDSRNRCLDLSSKNCKYTIMLDDTYVIKNDLIKFLQSVDDDIYAESYSFIIISGDVEYSSNRMVKTDLNLRYINKVHEIFEKNVSGLIPKDESCIIDIQNDYMTQRTKERKEQDLNILLEMVDEEPNNPRHLYYVAQTYFAMENNEKAVEYFRKRVEHPVDGHDFEKLDAYFELARTLNFKMGHPIEEVEDLYLKSYELDKNRADSIYFIGVNYHNRGDSKKAYYYFKKAFEIGYDINSQYSLKPTITFYFVPLFLSSLCYFFKDYELGEKCCLRFLQNNKNDTLDYQVITNWYKIFLIIKNKKEGTVKRDSRDKLCFIADGGFESWSGSDINKKGIGGSETYIIEMARAMKNNSDYDVYVFCKCDVEEEFEGVKYKPLSQIFDFFSVNYVKHCFVSRFLEYYPFVVESYVENVYIIFHDLMSVGSLIPKSEKLKKIFCLSDWHVEHVKYYFPDFSDIIVSFNYGINKEQFLVEGKKKKPYRFIYTSFPNRGLLPLLNMWPMILEKFPKAELHLYVDLDGKWVNEYHRDEMNLIKEILMSIKRVYNHGWVSKKKLAKAWAKTDVWFYPCKFYETFCLTALEAALSKTLAITNGLCALDETVGDRGLKLEGNVMSVEWQQNAVVEVVKILGDKVERDRMVESNFRWAMGMGWEERGRLMLEIIGENSMEYVGMYNWTNDIPLGSREVFKGVIDYFNGKGIREPRVLEIGSFSGTSLIEILRNIPNSVGYALDSWANYGESMLMESMVEFDVESSFDRNVGRVGLGDRVVKVKSDSQEKMMEYFLEGRRFDFIYVDGSHLVMDVYMDCFLAWKILNVGGVMGIDDFGMEGELLDVPKHGVIHFMRRHEGSYKILHKGYRIFLEKI